MERRSTTGLGMNVDNEINVLRTILLFKCKTNKDLIVKGIIERTTISESTLRNILERFEKRGWIKKYDVWDPEKITVLHNTTNFKKIFLEANEAYRKVLSEDEGSYERRRDNAKEMVRKKLIPKKKTGYHISIFPYLIGDLEGTTVPKGHKRRWRLEAKKIKPDLKSPQIIRF